MVLTVVATGFDSEYYRKLDAQKASITSVGDMMGNSYSPSSNYSVGVVEAPARRESEPRVEYNREPVNNDLSRDNSARIEYNTPTNDAHTTRMNEQGNASVDASATEFTTNNRTNMWDSIRSNETEDDLDVPPTLRDRLRNKNRD